MTRKDAGFTLVEVLVAVALLGMLTILAYGAVRFGAFSWQHATEQREIDTERDAVIRVLRQAIRGAYPAFGFPDYADRRIAFDGHPSRLDLVAPLPDAIEPGVMAHEAFYLDADPAKPGLFMAWALDLPAARGGLLPLRSFLLATDVASLRFSYFGRLQPDQPAAWWDHWSGMTGLPGLVRVRAWRIGATQTPWLDILLETATTTTTNCVYLAEEPSCRRLE